MAYIVGMEDKADETKARKESENEEVNAGEWHTVTRKQWSKQPQNAGRIDIATKGKWSTNQDTTTFFFSEIPDTHGAKEMLRAFQYYGEVIEVVIPPKQNKWGRRFGFVRFRNVNDPRMFAVKLDNIIIGINKIHVNMPRFERERNGQGRVQPNYGQQKKNVEQPKVQLNWRRVDEGNNGTKTNAKVINWRQNKQAEPKVAYYRKNNFTELTYNAAEEDLSRFKKMYIGVVKTPGSTHYIQEVFSMQGFFSIKVTPLGANKVLMEEMEEGMMKDFISDAGEWIYEKFEDIRGCCPDEVDN